MSYDVSLPSNQHSLNKGSLAEELSDSKFSEGSRSHAPRLPAISDLFKHFGGLDLEEESDVSGGEDEALPSDDMMSSEDQISVRSSISRESELPESGRGVFVTYFILLKAFIGVGVLYLPSLYEKTGWVVSTAVLAGAALIATCGLMRLVECKVRTNGSYSEISRMALGKRLEFVVNLLLFSGQMLYGTAYLAYIVLNIVSMADPQRELFSLPIEWCVGLLLALILCPLVCIRRQESFFLVFMLANIVMIMALAGFTVPKLTLQKNIFHVLWPKSHQEVLKLVGIALFSFEGYGLVIPSHQQLKHKQSYPEVLTLCTVTVFVFYSLFGILTSSEGGTALTEAVTFRTLVDDLGCHQTLAHVLSISLMLCLVVGYLLTTYPSMRIAEWALNSVLRSRKRWLQTALRVMLVMVTILMAILYNGMFASVIVFMGFFICVPLVILVPAYSHIVLVASSWYDRLFDVLLLIVGVGLLTAGVFNYVPLN